MVGMVPAWRQLTALVIVAVVSASSAAAQVAPATTPLPDAESPAPAAWHMLPVGLLYGPYLAGEKEPRLTWSVLREFDRGTLFELTVGGRVGLFRKGLSGAVGADGWQIDLEGAAQPRLGPDYSYSLEAVDYRAGLLWTSRRGRMAIKAGYYHLSAHVGDEFLVRHPEVERVDYVRDSVLVGAMYDVRPNLQVYAEMAYAFIRFGGAEPLEVQAGVQYGAARPTTRRGGAVAAVNIHLRQELGLGGGVNLMAGWGWFSQVTGHRLRLGLQAYSGKSVQYSTFRRSERMFGPALWFDF